jgi:hypothetical protein
MTSTTTETIVIRNVPNHVLKRFPCTLCGGVTEKQEYLFTVTIDGASGIVCDHCAEHPWNIPVYVRREIQCLQARIAELKYLASRTYKTEVVPVPADHHDAQGDMYSEDDFPPWMRERLGLPAEPELGTVTRAAAEGPPRPCAVCDGTGTVTALPLL